jgi:hypothetical protein
VGLFGRKRANDVAAEPEAGTAAGTGADGIPDAEATGASATFDVPDDDAWEPEAPFSRLRGPFDRSEVTGDDSRLDLGSLSVAVTPGLQVALQVDENTQTPTGVQLTVGRSSAYLQAYAAPRTMGIWPEIREEIARSVVAEGGRAEVVTGPLGKELHLHQRGGAPLRLVGVDGPRWFLRGLLSGPAATNDAAADALIEVIRATVVNRGPEAMAPREQLPLRLPTQLTDSGEPTEAGGDEPEASDSAAPPQRGYADLRPFDRGPEITEVH